MKHLLINRKTTLLTIRLCAVGLAFFIQKTVIAQNNTFPTTGNVGIGTTSPSSKLSIVGSNNTGNLKIANSTNNAGDKWWMGFNHGTNTADDNDRARIGVDILSGGAGRLFFTTGLMNSQTERMRIDENGNVGIGTASPAQKLDVNGTIQTTGFKLPTGAGAGKVLTSDANGVASWAILTGNSSGQSGWTQTTSTLTTTLNVGIGITSPTQQLEVNGDAVINGVYVGKGAGTYSVRLGSSISGSGQYNTAIGSFAMNGNTTGTQNTALGSTALNNNTTGSYNTAIGFQALTINNGNYNVAVGFNAGTSQTSGNNNIMIGNNAQAPSLTGSNQMTIGNLIYGTGMTGSLAGNVGIGTTSPSQKLDVVGTVKATQFNMALPSPLDQTAQYIPKADANGNMIWTKFRDIHDIYTATWGTNINANGYKLVASGGTGADTLGMRLDTRGGIWTDGGYSCFPKNVPDYVFATDYTLMPLAETEQYIKAQKHLPGIPSEAEYKKRGGVELYELSMKLLEKVEELTLHLIEQNKEKDALNQKMAAMQQEINSLSKR